MTSAAIRLLLGQWKKYTSGPFFRVLRLPVKVSAAAIGAENLAFENIGSEGIDFSVCFLH